MAKRSAKKSKSAPKLAPKAPPQSASSGPRPIYVLSDSTGNLGRHILSALLTQFPHGSFRLETRSFIRSPQKIAQAFDQIARDPGVVFYGLLDDALKKLVTKRCAELGVGGCDFTGPFVEFLSKHSGVTPGKNYELLHRVDEAYHRRVKALEFTLEHDDALGLETIHEADIVLAGISRTSKTPTSIYLAQQGYRVANVALAIQVEPPKELLALDGKKVVGLVIDASVLADIRERRGQAWRMDANDRYTDHDEIEKEIAWSRRLFMKQNWPILDVTNQAIEETAARIANVLGLTTGG